MTTIRIGIIFGGACEEHPVSVKSAQAVARNLDTTKYEPFWIGITPEGDWKLCDGPCSGWESQSSTQSVHLSPDRNVHGLMVQGQDDFEIKRLDLVFPVLHGPLGEDGAIQGLLELAGIPYIGCGIGASAVCMDKSLTYTVANSAGIDTPRFRVVVGNEEVDSSALEYPVFVKPARSGSSFGVSKVVGPDGLQDAIRTAREYDTKVLIEEAVVGSEIGCAVLEGVHGPAVGEVDRVNLSHGFFRIHQEDSPETGSENSNFIVPADISSESRQLIQESAKAVFNVLGCQGLARVDLFLTDEGQIVLNEVNTMPGMTSYSRYPRMMTASGMGPSEVIDHLVSTTLERKRP